MTKKISSATSGISQAAEAGNMGESEYHSFLAHFQLGFEQSIVGQSVFTTDMDGEALWDAYLAAVPEEHRQTNNCQTCKAFIRRVGNLVTVEEGGQLRSVFWNEANAPAEVYQAVAAARRLVEASSINGVFLTSEPVLGTPVTGAWRHLSVVMPQASLFRAGVFNAEQVRAKKREDFACLNVALNEFKPELLERARVILDADALSRSKKFLGVVEWLIARQADRKKPNGKNLLWKAVATAPAGFCTPRSTMVGALLTDLSTGMAFEAVKRRFNANLHPLQYQRAQVAPAEGNIKQAEEAFKKTGLERSLERRFATVEEVQALWRPEPARQSESNSGSIFGHLKPKDSAPALAPLKLPAQVMTWVKFRDTVLPTAEKVEMIIPSTGHFGAIVTATHADAPPLIMWDREEQRNPFTWYHYIPTSQASQWSLRGGSTIEVLAISLKPNLWFTNDFEHQGVGLILSLKGAKDANIKELALFSENLRSDLHHVRSTIEAFSKSRKLTFPEGEANLASGYVAFKDAKDSQGRPRDWNIHLRVTSKGQALDYTLDRWD